MTCVTKTACPYAVGDSVEVLYCQWVKAIVSHTCPLRCTIHTPDGNIDKEWQSIRRPKTKIPRLSVWSKRANRWCSDGIQAKDISGKQIVQFDFHKKKGQGKQLFCWEKRDRHQTFDQTNSAERNIAQHDPYQEDEQNNTNSNCDVVDTVNITEEVISRQGHTYASSPCTMHNANLSSPETSPDTDDMLETDKDDIDANSAGSVHNTTSPETLPGDMLETDNDIETSLTADGNMEAGNDIMEAWSAAPTIGARASPSPTSPEPETPPQRRNPSRSWSPALPTPLLPPTSKRKNKFGIRTLSKRAKKDVARADAAPEAVSPHQKLLTTNQWTNKQLLPLPASAGQNQHRRQSKNHSPLPSTVAPKQPAMTPKPFRITNHSHQTQSSSAQPPIIRHPQASRQLTRVSTREINNNFPIDATKQNSQQMSNLMQICKEHNQRLSYSTQRTLQHLEFFRHADFNQIIQGFNNKKAHIGNFNGWLNKASREKLGNHGASPENYFRDTRQFSGNCRQSATS